MHENDYDGGQIRKLMMGHDLIGALGLREALPAGSIHQITVKCGPGPTPVSVEVVLMPDIEDAAHMKSEVRCFRLVERQDDDSGEKYTVGEGEGESSEGGAEDDPPPFKGKPQVGGGKDRMNKGAMDETTVRKVVTTAVDSAVAAERAAQKALRDAEREVRAYVGDVVGCLAAVMAAHPWRLDGE